MHNYIFHSGVNIIYDGIIAISNVELLSSINETNDFIKKLGEMSCNNGIDIFPLLGMRNLSGFVGESFAKNIVRCSNGKLESNLHQDGYPDLLLVDTPAKRSYYESLYTEVNGVRRPNSKADFSPFLYGGIEIKATCGTVPPASATQPKLAMGEQRIDLLTGFDWKAHHRTTNHLLGILWDFIAGIPQIVACFYQDALTVNDWGKIVKPRKGGGRTTSVSIMTQAGVKKMCSNWVAVLDDDKYISKLASAKWIGARIKP